MVLNGTLFIQAFNFFIAYILMRELFFKPAWKAIQNEWQAHDKLIAMVKEKKQLLGLHQEEKKVQWKLAQKYFLIHIPPLGHPDFFIFRHLTPPLYALDYDEKILRQLAQRTMMLLKKRMLHVS